MTRPGRQFTAAWLARTALLAPAVATLVLVSANPGRAASPGTVTPRFATPAGNAPTHLSPVGTSVLPDGRLVTPAGRTVGVDLVPLNISLSHDGRRVYVSDEGEDNLPAGRGDEKFNRFVSVVDTTTLARQRVEDDALQYGMAENSAGTELYVSEGATDSVGVFTASGGPLRRIGEVRLPTGDFPWGLTTHPSAPFAYATGFMGNSLSVVDTRTHTAVARVATGEFPYDAAVSPDGKRLYVSNFGVYNTQAAAQRLGIPVPPVAVPPATAAGYNSPQSSSIWTYDISNPATPVVVAKLRIGRDVNGYDVLSGSLPSSLAVSPDGRRLAVTASNNDIVALIDTATTTIRSTIDTRAVPGGPTGSQPNAVRWSPDGTRLYIAQGGLNAVAVYDAASGSLLGRIPTGWYPSALAVSAGGDHVFIASAKGVGTGANGPLDPGPTANNDHYPGYIGSLLKGTVQDVYLGSGCASLAPLSDVVAVNNGLVPTTPGRQDGDAVIPTAYGAPSASIKHVVVILKENRTYDQILGDLPGTERSQALAFYGGKVTPNEHALATQFAVSDNFYTTSQSSTDGHYLYETGHENEWTQKTVPSTQANAFQGNAAGIVNTSPENLPIGGYLWHNNSRAGITTRIYGETAYLVGIGPNNAAIPTVDVTSPGGIGALSNASTTISPTYPTNLQSGMDEARADDFSREVSAFSKAGFMPSLSFMVLPDDHTDGITPGATSPQSFISENDHAAGRIVETLSRSPFWKDTAVFITEDDTQGGNDHVDAQRTVLLAAGPYVRHGYVSHVHHSTGSLLKTVNLILGAPPTSLQELLTTPMTDMFQSKPVTAAFTSIAREIPDTTNPTATAAAANPALSAAIRLQGSVPEGIDQGGSALPAVLELAHQGMVAAGDPTLPKTPPIIQHTLAAEAPPALQPCSAPTAALPMTGSRFGAVPILVACGLLLGAVAGARGRRRLAR